MKNIILYHGSRGGISGSVKPQSLARRDFGSGFYMTDNQNYAKYTVSFDETPSFCVVSIAPISFSSLKTKRLFGMDLIFFILYNRGKLEDLKGTSFYERISGLGKNSDFIIGSVMDDIIDEPLRRFIKNQITDIALLESMKILNHEMQYVAKTDRACSIIKILSERNLYHEEINETTLLAKERKNYGIQIADEVQTKYSGQGRTLLQISDDILKGKKYVLSK